MGAEAFLLAGFLLTTLCVLLAGFPVAFTLCGVSVLFAGLGHILDVDGFINLVPSRIFGSAMTNDTLLSIPFFIFMGVLLEKSRLAEDLLKSLAFSMRKRASGIMLSVVLVGALLAASTGIVGATVIAMTSIGLPMMLSRGISPALASGTICASGTLGQIIPPSIILVILGDQLAGAYQTSQSVLQQEAWAAGRTDFSPDSVSVGDLFAGAIIPGLLLVILYMLYLLVKGSKKISPKSENTAENMADNHAKPPASLLTVLSPLFLILAVMGAIAGGVAPPSEAASLGAAGAVLLAAQRVIPDDSLKLSPPLTPFIFIGVIAGAIIAGHLYVGERVFTIATVGGGVIGFFISLGVYKMGLYKTVFNSVYLKSDLLIHSGLFATAFFILSVSVKDYFPENLLGTIKLICLFLIAGGLGVSFRRLWRSGILGAANQKTLEMTSMIFAIIIGAMMFSLVFRSFGGELWIMKLLNLFPGHGFAMMGVLLVMFLLGFFLDVLEIILILVPSTAPALLLSADVSPVWLGVMMAMVLQTAYLTPPFGLSLFYFSGAAQQKVSTPDLYKGVLPFICLQLCAVLCLWVAPILAEGLPDLIYR